MIERMWLAWTGLARREQRVVAYGAAVLLAVIAYLAFFEPAWQGRARLRQEIPALRAQVAQMQGLAAEAGRLAAVPKGGEAPKGMRTVLEQSVRSAGLGANLSQLSASGELFELRFNSVAHGAWLEWLDTTLRETRLRVAEASVTREAAPGVVSARVVLEAPRGSAR